MASTVIIYHANCLDGFSAAYAAWKKYGESAEYIPANYGEPPPTVTGKVVYILDFSYPRDVLLKLNEEAAFVRVIDHHLTAKEDLAGLDFATFDMEKSGAVLAWEYFHPETRVPMLLYHVQDRDLWQFKLLDTREILEALRNLYPMTFEIWDSWCKAPNAGTNLFQLDKLRSQGKDLMKVFMNDIDDLLGKCHKQTVAYQVGLACNASPKYASELGNQLALKSGTFGLVYHYDGARQEWQCSLRSVGDYDVSKLAQHFGGGGHRNAAGFSVKSISELGPS